MLRNLKIALMDHPEPAWKVAHSIGIQDSRLSKIVNGIIQANSSEKQNLSIALDKSIAELFPADFGNS